MNKVKNFCKELFAGWLHLSWLGAITDLIVVIFFTLLGRKRQ
ncbi:hypothetical protein [uncultured Limosilactobacillus sp.]|nr:hypothetical protein [uncultured Limosilactobacillus sp.]